MTSSVQLNVWIDGQLRGMTPLTVTLPSGDHTVMLKDERLGLFHTRSVRLERGEERREEWRPAKGKVAFRVVPYAEVFLGKQPLGLTPLDPLELWEGRYEFRFVNKDTDRVETREVVIAGGKEVIVKVDLRADK